MITQLQADEMMRANAKKAAEQAKQQAPQKQKLGGLEVTDAPISDRINADLKANPMDVGGSPVGPTTMDPAALTSGQAASNDPLSKLNAISRGYNSMGKANISNIS